MKKLFVGLSFAVIAVFTTLSACKKDISLKPNPATTASASVKTSKVTSHVITPEELDQILALSSDSLFQELVRIRVREYNYAILNRIPLTEMNGSPMNSAKVRSYANLLGYSSVEEFITTTNHAKELESSLKSTYGIDHMNGDLFIEAVALIDPAITPPLSMVGKPAHCQKTYENTILSIQAESTLMHIACAGADLSVLGGIICHASVVVWGISQTNLADAAYEACH